MKYGKITPLYKFPKEGSRQNKADYRPVTVLTVFSKIEERYLKDRKQTVGIKGKFS